MNTCSAKVKPTYVEPVASVELITPNQFYTMDMLKETIPYLDEICYFVMYNEINKNFITEEEKQANNLMIERLKLSHQLRLKPDLEKLMENDDNKKIDD